jgi:hypothetical protein
LRDVRFQIPSPANPAPNRIKDAGSGTDAGGGEQNRIQGRRSAIAISPEKPRIITTAPNRIVNLACFFMFVLLIYT